MFNYGMGWVIVIVMTPIATEGEIYIIIYSHSKGQLCEEGEMGNMARVGTGLYGRNVGHL
jgi:hypothetical protein